MNTPQEERYYQVKAKVVEILGAEPPREQMDRLFFEVVEPEYQRASGAEKRLREVREALGVLRSVFDG